MTQGSRLVQLVALRAQIDREIERERRAEWRNGRGVQDVPSTSEALLTRMGVTAVEVKRWGVEQGLIAKVSRGRVSLLLVQAYDEAHR